MRGVLLKPTKGSLRRAAAKIKEGGLVSFPTETVYGLGANALDPLAVARLFEVKERPHFDPIIVHIAELGALKRLCREIDDRAIVLAQRFWPGPLTLVLPKTSVVPDIVTAGLTTVAIRMPSYCLTTNQVGRDPHRRP